LKTAIVRVERPSLLKPRAGLASVNTKPAAPGALRARVDRRYARRGGDLQAGTKKRRIRPNKETDGGQTATAAG
jgi:hypothetical protein